MIALLCAVPLLWAAVTDYQKRIIPDWTWIALVLIGLVSAFLLPAPALYERIAGLLLPGLCLLLLAVAENHYPTMSCEEICALPVAELAAKDSALFLWATFPQLPEALRVVSAWGFQFKTVAFVWLKQNRRAKTWFYGLGFWTRSNAKICLLATRGHPKRRDKGIHQFIISPIEAHSKKPDEARERIVRLMGDLPRVELFARQETEGWQVWGNEIANSITL